MSVFGLVVKFDDLIDLILQSSTSGKICARCFRTIQSEDKFSSSVQFGFTFCGFGCSAHVQYFYPDKKSVIENIKAVFCYHKYDGIPTPTDAFCPDNLRRGEAGVFLYSGGKAIQREDLHPVGKEENPSSKQEATIEYGGESGKRGGGDGERPRSESLRFSSTGDAFKPSPTGHHDGIPLGRSGGNYDSKRDRSFGFHPSNRSQHEWDEWWSGRSSPNKRQWDERVKIEQEKEKQERVEQEES
jgi:hypothetical protein